MEFTNLKQLVKIILTKDEATRSDDFKLWLRVANEIYDDNGLNYTPGETDLYLANIFDVMMNAKKWGLPPFETVTRARRCIQEIDDSLCNPEVKEKRMDKAEKIKESIRNQNELKKRYIAGDNGVIYDPRVMKYIYIGSSSEFENEVEEDE